MAGGKGRADVPAAYEGREHAFIKHQLLRAYLEKLFLIIGMSSTRIGITEICYVDCFAGPWSHPLHWKKGERLKLTEQGR